jgi:signal transduction histidine kinase
MKVNRIWRKFYNKTSQPRKQAFTHIHQAIFIVFMLMIALIFRQNPYLVYPHIIYLFIAFLLSNLATNYILTRYKVYYAVVDLMVVTNCIIITALQEYSGGIHSYLWVLYLLPIFTAAIMLETRQLVLTSFVAMFGTSYFYGNPLTEWDYDLMGVELISKLSLLFLGALLMKSLAAERDKVESELEGEREKLDRMSFDVANNNMETLKNADMLEMGKRTSGVIHDLGTPVTVILGSARLLLQEEVPSKTDIQRILDAALLCRNILSSAMKVAKGQEYKFEPLDLADPLESAMAIASPILTQEHVTLKHAISKEKLPQVNGSSIHLERLFINLLMNAKNVLKDGGEVKVSLGMSPDAKFLEFILDDNGPGFPPDLLKTGPKPFATTRSTSGGTGLGLIVCKEVVEKHGGEFKLSNRVLGGARVTARFPVYDPNAVKAPEARTSQSQVVVFKKPA